MRRMSILAMVVAGTACQAQPDLTVTPTSVPGAGQPGTGASATAQPPVTEAPCSTSTVPVTVGGQQQQATVESCQQPDGGWRITQYTPGLPPQVYVVPPPPAGSASAYPDYYPYPSSPDYYPDPFSYPYWFANPWFFGLGPTIFVAQRFPRFHRGFGPGFHRGFGHGFHRGFGHGFHRGFGRGFQRAGGIGGHHR
jgi:hypothetical protein